MILKRKVIRKHETVGGGNASDYSKVKHTYAHAYIHTFQWKPREQEGFKKTVCTNSSKKENNFTCKGTKMTVDSLSSII